MTHNHHRDDFWSHYADAEAEVERFQANPDTVLRHIGSVPPNHAADANDEELRLVA